MGCHEPLAGGVGAVHSIGGVWFGANRGMPAGMSRCSRLCYGWAGGLRSCRGVVTSGAKRGGTGGDALRRAMHGGGSRGRWWDGWKGLTVTGCQRLWWRSWRWRCWVNDREKPSTPGNAGARPLMVSCGGAANTWPSAVEAKISGFDVVDGSGADLRSVYGWRARQRAVRGDDEDSVLVAVVGWHRDGWWACCVGGAGRDLRHVGVRGGDWCGGPTPRNVH